MFVRVQNVNLRMGASKMVVDDTFHNYTEYRSLLRDFSVSAPLLPHEIPVHVLQHLIPFSIQLELQKVLWKSWKLRLSLSLLLLALSLTLSVSCLQVLPTLFVLMLYIPPILHAANSMRMVLACSFPQLLPVVWCLVLVCAVDFRSVPFGCFCFSYEAPLPNLRSLLIYAIYTVYSILSLI